MKQFSKKIILHILEWEAKRIIARYKPRIVAVVGSVGKTSTKDAIATALAGKFRVGKSKKSYNSEFGVPLAIIGSSSGGTDIVKWVQVIVEGFLLSLFHHQYPEILVLEVGADRPGDILRTAGWLETDVVVATAYGEVPVHIEYFSSKENLVLEDKEICKTLKHDGVLVVNGDDGDACSFTESWSGVSQTVSMKAGDIMGTQYALRYDAETGFPQGFSVSVRVADLDDIPLTLSGVIGEQFTYPLLSACAVGLYMGMSRDDIMGALSRHVSPPGRMRIISGQYNICIIDDTYNAAPAAVTAALWTLRDIRMSKKGRKIAVLGDMMELGHFSVEQHKKIGRLATSICDILVTVGVRSMITANEALEAGMKVASVTHVEDSVKAGELLASLVKPHDIVLIKGSQSMRMEKVVMALMAEPEKKADMLVRQDDVWVGR